MPVFTLDAIVRIGLPLYVVTMASQNLPGLAVMKANGFELAPAPLFVITGLASAATAFFGGHSSNLAAITAAICAGPEAHPERSKRWPAPISAGVVYLLLAPGASLAAAFIAASPPLLIQAVAGLALLSSLAAALVGRAGHRGNAAAGDLHLRHHGVRHHHPGRGRAILGAGGRHRACWCCCASAAAAGGDHRHMSLPHAVIIAGGEGQRLGGVRKADLRIGGVRQIDRVIEALGAVAAPHAGRERAGGASVAPAGGMRRGARSRRALRRAAGRTGSGGRMPWHGAASSRACWCRWRWIRRSCRVTSCNA